MQVNWELYTNYRMLVVPPKVVAGHIYSATCPMTKVGKKTSVDACLNASNIHPIDLERSPEAYFATNSGVGKGTILARGPTGI
jgi:hypothetical protein